MTEKRARSRVEIAVMRRRRTALRIHRWVSLLLAVWVVMQAFTGGVMIMGDQVNRLVHPHLFDHGTTDRGVDAAVAAARSAVPDMAVKAVSMPAVERGVYRVTVSSKSGAQRWVYVDPSTAAVNGVRDPKGGFVAWAGRWHNSLLQTHPILGIAPGQVVGWLGIATILVLLYGLHLWYWPRVQRWKALRRVRVHRGAFTFNGDLHRLVGVLFAPVLLVILVTGANQVFRDQIRSFWYAVTPGADAGPSTAVPPPKSTAVGSQPAPASVLLASAAAIAIHGHVDSITLGAKPDGAAVVKLTHGYDPSTGPEGRGGDVTAYLDQVDAHVLKVVRADDKPATAQAYEYWAVPVHFGTFGGPVSRSVWLAACAAPLVLLGSGVSMVLVRRAKRRRRVRRIHQALPRLDRTQVRTLARRCAVRPLRPDDVVVREGDRADSFFVIVSGEATVTQRDEHGEEREIRRLGPGEHFGEIGLLDERPRTATVTGRTTGEMLVFSRAGYTELTAMSAAAVADLHSVGDHRLADDLERERSTTNS